MIWDDEMFTLEGIEIDGWGKRDFSIFAKGKEFLLEKISESIT